MSISAATTHLEQDTPLPAAEVLKHPGFRLAEWDLKPSQSGYCSVAKTRTGGPFRIFWEIHGGGDTKIVWIMGLGAFRTAWKRQTKYFGHDRSSQYSSLVYDNRGMGLSDKPSCRYSTTEMAHDAIELLTELKWLDPSNPKRNLNVIGVSMGGMIAQELGLLIPEHVNTLMLVSTAPRLVRTVPFIENLRQRINMFVPRDIDFQLDEIAHRLMSAEFLSLPDTDSSDPKLNYPTIRDRFAAGELAKRMDRGGFTRKGFILQAIAAGWHSKSPAQLKELGDKVGRNRIFVLHGTTDKMITFHHYELLVKELGAGIEKRSWDGKGHVLMWEAEDDFNDVIEMFVKKATSYPS